MTRSHTTSPAWNPGVADAAGPERVAFFRRLFLLFVLGSMAGMGTAIAFEEHADATRAVTMAVSFVVLACAWVLRHRRGSFPRWMPPLEALLLVAFMSALRAPLNWVGVCYAAVMYRASFGERRDAWLVALTFAAAYLAGLVLVARAFFVLEPIILVYLAAIVFGAYVSMTLVETLRRDRRQVEELSASREALRDSEQRFRSVAHCLREALLITDTDDHIILANARVREVLGYSPEEVIGRIAADLLLPRHQRTLFRDRMRRRLSGETELYEVELIRKDGSTIFAEISASPYRDASGEIVGTLGAISDISHRKRLEERLRQSLRLEAVGQLAGGVAHDFNNLLTVVKCHTELMKSELPSASPARDNVVEIEQTVNQGARLVQQLLAFGRQQVLQPRRLTLAQAVTDATPLLRGMVGPGVELVVLADDPGNVYADPMQIEQVLVTLVRNADEAMAAGGRIVVETLSRVLEVNDPRVIANDATPGRYSVLVVADNGHGMSADVLERIFQPFFTTKEPGAGTGLALAGMYGVVKQSGGFVDVESVPMRGTTFRVYLPDAPWDEGSWMRPVQPALQST